MNKVDGYLTQAEEALERLSTAVAGFDMAQWDVPESEDGWSIHQVMSHISANTRFHATLARTFLSGETDPDRSWQADRDAALAAGVDATLAWMRAENDQILPTLRTIQDSDLAVKGTSKVGEISVEYLLRRLATHVRQHAKHAARIRTVVNGA